MQHGAGGCGGKTDLGGHSDWSQLVKRRRRRRLAGSLRRRLLLLAATFVAVLRAG